MPVPRLRQLGIAGVLALVVPLLLTAGAPAADDQFQVGGTGDCSGAAASVTCTVRSVADPVGSGTRIE